MAEACQSAVPESAAVEHPHYKSLELCYLVCRRYAENVQSVFWDDEITLRRVALGDGDRTVRTKMSCGPQEAGSV